MFCVNCGNKLNDSMKFCPCCGTMVNSAAKTVPQCGEETAALVQTIENPVQQQRSEVPKRGSPGTKKAGKSILTKFGAAAIIIGLVCAIIGGYASSLLADSYRGNHIETGYYNSDGKFVSMTSGTIGGNAKAVSYYSDLKVMICVLGGFVVLMGIIMLCIGLAQDGAPLQRKCGRIIDLDSFAAVIEFEDGSRARAANQSGSILALGDQGVFELKGQRIIGFERRL